MTDSALNNGVADKVLITKHEEVNRDGAVFILGTVQSHASDAVRGLAIEADLFDKDGKFVEQCSEYLKGALGAGESRNFKVACGGCCKDKPVVAHESYKIRVLGL
jgi:hypothetical protein